VIDTRGAEAFAAAHIPGAINIPLNRGFVNWAGWLIPYDRPFFVLVEDEAGRIQVDRNLALIGLEAYARYVPAAVVDEWRMAGQPLQWFARIPESEAPSVLNGARPPFILDVRGKSEYDSHHVPGAVNFPLGHLRSHLSEIPKDRPIVVYCQAGNRSPIGASILQAAGFEQVADLRGGFESWKPPSKP
jgi:hydroxyacylglutathione hydrolase